MRAGRSIARGIAAAALLGGALAAGCGGGEEPVVSWSAALEEARSVSPGSVVRVRVNARPSRGWYFYSLTQPAGGPIPAKIWLSDTVDFRPAGSVRSPEPHRSFDEIFGLSLEKYPEAASFTLPVAVPSGAPQGRSEIRVSAMYQACNDTVCLSPRTVTMRVPVQIESR